jgi:hypothetical protein
MSTPTRCIEHTAYEEEDSHCQFKFNNEVTPAIPRFHPLRPFPPTDAEDWYYLEIMSNTETSSRVGELQLVRFTI